MKPGPSNDTCVSDRLYNSIYTLNVKKLIILISINNMHNPPHTMTQSQ